MELTKTIASESLGESVPVIEGPRDQLKHDLAVEVLRSFGETRLSVTGSSMLPAVWPGDILTIRRQRAEEIREGEIVLSQREGWFVAHRVMRKIRQDGVIMLLTRGDRLKKPDPLVAAEDLLGRVTVIQRGRRLVNPRLTLRGRLSSWALCRSELATRSLLYMQRKIGVKAARGRSGKPGVLH
jgi:signal peptidase I